jgi:iron complex transport system substrate-binding protein
MNKITKYFFIIILSLCCISCNQKPVKTVIDRGGHTVNIHGPVGRIVSTAPSNTEIIVDLGAGGKLVAIDRHSANVSGVPEGLPLLDFFYPDAEVIIGLEPDIIIASGHNPTGSGEDPFRLLRDIGIPVVYIPMSKSIEDIYRDIVFISDLLYVQHRGEELIQSMKEQIAEITQYTAGIKTKKTVYFEISAAPEMMTFGKDSFLDDMISVIGGKNIFAADNWLISPGAESIISRNPDVILTNVNYIDDPAGEIKNRPGFNHVNAVINNHVYQIDTDSSVRPSAGIIKALRQMATAVYPELHE